MPNDEHNPNAPPVLFMMMGLPSTITKPIMMTTFTPMRTWMESVDLVIQRITLSGDPML